MQFQIDFPILSTIQDIKIQLIFEKIHSSMALNTFPNLLGIPTFSLVWFICGAELIII